MESGHTSVHGFFPREPNQQNKRLGWTIWVFPKIVVPQNGWCIVENPVKMDDLGVPLF